MKEKIENKILFLKAVLKDIDNDYNSMEYTIVSIENDYSIERLFYNSQIKVLEDILKES